MKKTQASFEYIVLLGIFIGVLAIIIVFSSHKVLDYIVDNEIGDSAKSLTRAVDQVSAIGPGSQKVVQIKIPKSVVQAYAAGKEVTYRAPYLDKMNDFHFRTRPHVFGLLESTRGLRFVVLKVEDNGFVSLNPMQAPNFTDKLSFYNNNEVYNSTDVIEATRWHNLTIQGDTDCTVDGYVGNGCSFDGNGDYLSIPDHDYSKTDLWTVSFWTYSKSDNHLRPIGKKADYNYIGLSYEDIRIYFQNSTLDGQDFTASSITKNTWQMITARHNGSQSVGIFVDSTFQGEIAVVPNWSINNIGAAYEAADNSATDFNGYIDEVMIFNRSLSDEEIELLYLLGRSPP